MSAKRNRLAGLLLATASAGFTGLGTLGAAIALRGSPAIQRHATVVLASQIGFQTGVTVMLQVFLSRPVPSQLRRGCFAVAAALSVAVLALYTVGTNVLFVWASCATAMSACLGLAEGAHLVPLAFEETSVPYQVRNATRSAAITAALLGSIALSPRTPWPILAPWIGVAVTLMFRRPRPTTGGWREVTVPTLLGVGTSLVYRNDTTIYRSRLVATPQFEVASITAAAYAVVTGGVGLLITGLVVPGLRSHPQYIDRVRRGLRSLGPLAALGICSCAFVTHKLESVSWAVVSSLVLAVATALTSFGGVVCHLIGRSSALYSVGIVSVAALLLVPSSLRREGLLIENAVLLLLQQFVLRAGDNSKFA